ncbi:MAG: multi-sensor hybrid histidine kinase [Puniceicoccaceae bacterium 5H]|nr:MAG: multi-sensor hybrid histidine kinase [Puniceicoccaceae bacterium 5H]
MQLKRLVERLRSHRPDILKEWENRSEQEKNPGRPLLTRRQFYDHIPAFLDLVEQRLHDYAEKKVERRTHAPWMPELPEKLREHGRQRWHQGYHLGSLVRDWHHLRGAVFHVLDYILRHEETFDGEVLRVTYGVISELISTGVGESVNQFEKLRQGEAQSRLGDLEQHMSLLDRVGRYQRESLLEFAHDLSGNLSILTRVTNRLKAIGPDEQNGRLTEVLSLGLETALRLLDEVRELTSLEAEEPEISLEDTTIEPLVCQAAEPFMTLNEGKIEFDLRGPPDLTVETDPLKLGRILQNLLHNAFKFTPRGQIRIEWKVVDDDLWRLTVHNHFPDAAEAEAPSVDGEVESHEGDGLGLAIVRRLSEALRGQMAVRREDHHMSVQIVLPRGYPRHEQEGVLVEGEHEIPREPALTE